MRAAVAVQVLVFFTWVVRGVADTVSMWDAVERVASFCTNIPEEAQIASNLNQVGGAHAQGGFGLGRGEGGGGTLETEVC